MRLLADENVPLGSVHSLRDAGLDVAWIGDTATGMADDEILRQARRQSRVLLTLDRDFGELVFLRKHEPPPAIILIRSPVTDPVLDIATPVVELLRSEKIEGFFWVMGREHWRRHPLPTA